MCERVKIVFLPFANYRFDFNVNVSEFFPMLTFFCFSLLLLLHNGINNNYWPTIDGQKLFFNHLQFALKTKIIIYAQYEANRVLSKEKNVHWPPVMLFNIIVTCSKYLVHYFSIYCYWHFLSKAQRLYFLFETIKYNIEGLLFSLLSNLTVSEWTKKKNKFPMNQ